MCGLEQHLRFDLKRAAEGNQFEIVHVARAPFDLGDSLARDVPADELAFLSHLGLGPFPRIAQSPDVRSYEIKRFDHTVPESVLDGRGTPLLGLYPFRYYSIEASPMKLATKRTAAGRFLRRLKAVLLRCRRFRPEIYESAW